MPTVDASEDDNVASMRCLARTYAHDLGWAVFPCWTVQDGTCACPQEDACSSPGKHPATAKGFKDATTNEASIDSLWSRHPDSNIGIATGPVSGIVVLDVDPGHGGDDSLAELERTCGRLPDTVESITGGGGRHIFFQIPDGVDIRNSAGNVGDGLDIRANGGYVIAPPSQHISGGQYEWEGSSEPWDVALAQMPDWLIDIITKPEPVAVKPAIGDVVTEGARNDTLARLAGTMRRKGMSEQAITAGLEEQNKSFRPPLPDDEVRAVAASISRYKASDITPEASNLTDLGNGLRFVDQHGQDVRYCSYSSHHWYTWTGTRWHSDDIGQVRQMAKSTALAIYGEASYEDGDDSDAVKKRKSICNWAENSQSNTRINAMLEMAWSEPGITILPEYFDTNSWLFNTATHTVDLRTLKPYKQRREDMLTMLSPVEYKPEAACPTWTKFLEDVFKGKDSIIPFLQKAVGYSLTGQTSEQVVFFCYGTGSNGKTTFLETVAALMGDYAQQAEFTTFLMKDRDNIRNDLAALKGARFISAVESQQGRRLDEVVVKQLTGGDRIRCRYLHREFFEYKPEFKIWFATNHKPEIRGTDEAIWRRIRLIPFDVTFTDAKQDKQLAAKLQAELPGILNWALEGIRLWREEGLGYPDEIREATEGYRAEMDILKDFLDDCTFDSSDGHVVKPYRVYTDWCEHNAQKPVGSKTFSQLLVERGYSRGKFGSESQRGFKGLELLPAWAKNAN